MHNPNHPMSHISHPIVPLVVLALAACSTSDEVPDVPTSETPEGALDFAAYVTRYSRDVGDVSEITELWDLVDAGGFGVFGFAHGTRMFDDYVTDVSVPSFFVNQQVTFKHDPPLPDPDDSGDSGDSGGSDDSGDSGDSGDSDDSGDSERPPLQGYWVYSPVKYFDNNEGARHSFFAYAPYLADASVVYATGKAPQLRYDISQDIDLLWAKPTKNLKKPDVGTPVTFHFTHALTKVFFHVAPFVDKVHYNDDDDNGHTDADHEHPITDPLPDGTTIRVRSIHLNGNIPFDGLMNTDNGTWKAGTTRQYFNAPGASEATWTGDGVDIPAYHQVEPASKLIPTQHVAIEVIYDVISEKGSISEHVTRKAVSQETLDLAQGKAYNIYLDLGLNSVKFFAEVGDWTYKDHNIDLPEEEKKPVLIETVFAAIIPWQAGVSDDVENGLHW